MTDQQEVELYDISNAPMSLINAFYDEMPMMDCPKCPVVIVTSIHGIYKLPPAGCPNCFGLGFIYLMSMT